MKTSSLIDLDIRDTTILKGLAISAIVLHNYFHLLSPVHENEFAFDPNHFRVFLATVVHPMLAIQAIFSFFGHFGVTVFVFLSAYGLSRSHWEVTPRWTAFMWSRIRKLYPTFLLVIVPWFVVGSLQAGPLLSLKMAGLRLAPMLAGFSNFLPGYGLPPVGPWWFIPFIMQFYAIWPFMRRLTLKFGYSGLLVLTGFSIILTYALNPLFLHWSINLMESPIGHMPTLCLGIIAARYHLRISPGLVPLACAVVLLGSQYYDFWLLTYVCAAFASVGLYIRLRTALRRYRWLEWVGQCSLLLFLLNGIVRVYGFMT